MTDYRILRWEGCKAYHVAGMRMDDIDPACPMLKFVAEKLNLSIEQRLWLAWLYSTCYSAPTAFYMIIQLPDPNFITQSDIISWWAENKNRMIFESDRRYVKNCNTFPKMFESYRKFTRQGQLRAFLDFKGDNDAETYNKVYSAVEKNLYFFGRYSIFMYLETIYNLTKFPMIATGLNLREARTSRNGLCYALGKDSWIRHAGKPAKFTKMQFDYLQTKLSKLYTELLIEYPDVPTTYWNLETSLCAYYKLFQAKRYAGYYIDRQMVEIVNMENLVPEGVDWKLLWQFRREHFSPLSLGEIQGWRGIRENMMNYFLDTGLYTAQEMRVKAYASAKI